MDQGQGRPRPSTAALTTMNSSGIFSYSNLRKLFVAGCAVNIILTFIPSAKIVHRGLLSRTVTSEEFVSNFDGIQLGFQHGQTGLAMLAVLIFGAWIVLAVMAFVNEKRVVFIVGGMLGGFAILLNLFSPNTPGVELLTLPLVLSYGADIALISGFFANPDEVA